MQAMQKQTISGRPEWTDVQSFYSFFWLCHRK